MKKNLFALLAAAICLAACTKNVDTPVEETATLEDTSYKGVVLVTSGETTYENEDIKVSLTFSQDGKKASVTLHDIKFVPAMPPVVVIVPDLEVSGENGEWTISGTEIDPTGPAGQVYSTYHVTDFTGTINGEDISFSLNFGRYPTSYTGHKE